MAREYNSDRRDSRDSRDNNDYRKQTSYNRNRDDDNSRSYDRSRSEGGRPMKGGRGKHDDPLIPRSTFAFFYRVESTLQDINIDNGSKVDLIAEAFSLTAGNVQHFCCNIAISPIIETLLSLATPSQLKKFTFEFLKRFRKISCNQRGSHVAETLITTFSGQLAKDQDDELLNAIIKIMEDDIPQNLNEYCSSHYSFAPFTALIKFCHGELEYKVRKHGPLRLFISKQTEKLADKSIAEPMNKLKLASENLLKELLEAFCEMLPDYSEPEPDFIGFDKWIQALLSLSAATKRDDLAYLIDNYGKCFFDVDEVNGAIKLIDQLDEHPVALHTMSAIFEFSTEEFIKPFVTFHILQRIDKLMTRMDEAPTATIRTYATLLSRADGAQTDRILEKIKPEYIGKFLTVQSHWFLISLIQLLDNADAEVAENFTKMVLAHFKITEADPELVKKLATLESEDTISSCGLKIIWAMIKHLAYPYNGIILSSVRKCTEEQFVSLACSPGGSHFLEDIIALRDTKFNKVILKTLSNKLAFLAAHVQGSYVVESLFNNTDKLAIMENLAERATITSKTPSGRHLWYKFDGSLYMKDRRSWARRFNVTLPDEPQSNRKTVSRKQFK